MKLWLLEAPEETKYRNSGRQNPGNDGRACAFVVRAETERDARCLAVAEEERLARYEVGEILNNEWLDPSLTSCTELTADGPAEVVVCDFYEP